VRCSRVENRYHLLSNLNNCDDLIMSDLISFTLDETGGILSDLRSSLFGAQRISKFENYKLDMIHTRVEVHMSSLFQRGGKGKTSPFGSFVG